MRKQICLPLFVYVGLIYGPARPLAAQDVTPDGKPASYIVFNAGIPVGIDAQGTVAGIGAGPYQCESFYRSATGTVVNLSVPGATGADPVDSKPSLSTT